MTDDEWEEIEDSLAAVFGACPLEAFAEVAGVILKRQMIERGLGAVDPDALDPEFAARLLISAWREAAVECYPDRDPAEIVDHLVLLVDHATARDGRPGPSRQRH